MSFDRSVALFNDLLYNEQTKSNASTINFGCALHLTKLLEQVSCILLTYSNSSVLDINN